VTAIASCWFFARWSTSRQGVEGSEGSLGVGVDKV
jgi:hypothetical protein